MKRSARIFLILLIFVITSVLFCGCRRSEKILAARMQALSGTWAVKLDHSETQARCLLENIDLYEEEIALADLSSLEYVKHVQFDENGNYRFYCDPESTKECVRTFFLGVFEDLYEHRSALQGSYERDFENMTETEFRHFYTELYGKITFDALISHFTEAAFDYDALAVSMESGTYTIEDTYLLCTRAGAGEAGSIDYSIDENDTLVLRFSNATEYYTRVA